MSEEVAHPRTVRLAAAGTARVVASPTAAAEALRAGAVVGGYELVRPIAKGATGSVFLARDLKLGRRVAIKFLVSTEGAVARRFLLEAQTTARCVHENIVVIHEVGSWQGIPFLVLEYLDGPALSAILAGAPLPLSRALELLVPVVRALQCAHHANIVHRDLKPDNIIVTRRGAVKVVDFGIAKAFHRELSVESTADSGIFVASNAYETLSGPGLVVGTLPYMAPEQWRGLDVDARCDLFAVGVILYRMLTSRHPSGSFAPRTLREFALSPLAYPSLAGLAPELPEAVVRIVDRCLCKHPDDRYGSADELLAELESLSRQARRAGTAVEECPFPGLSQFTVHDAARYFGRGREVTAALAILQRTAALALVGPSGSGKSSLALAGVAPSLRGSMSDCQLVTLRPGRAPLAALLDAVAPLVSGLTEARLRAEPGVLGVALRELCQARGGSLLLIVDQFEEVFTLTSHEAARQAFIDSLLAAADDVSSPIRLVLTLRSDFLHRVAEHAWLTDMVSDGMLLLTPPDRSTLRAALVRPLAQVGYELEDDELVEEILQDLESSTAPFPLLQLLGTQLWSHRDSKRRCLSRQAYRELGGVHGALAGQADSVLAGLSPTGRNLVRAILLRLVTSEGTRAVVDREDLLGMSPEAGAVLVSLVQARLLVVHEDDATVELIHEALIEQWPALRGWIQESREDFALRDRLVVAARQWAEAGHPAGLLWTGEALADMRTLLAHEVPLGARERAFVQASRDVDTRAARRRRLAVSSALVALALVALISIVALAAVRRAEGVARAQAYIARDEATRARAAERAVSEKVEQLERKERERQMAETAAVQSRRLAEQSQGEVVRSQQELEVALAEAQSAQRMAEAAARQARELAAKERAARDQLEQALARERERVEELRRQRSKIEQRL